MQQTDFNFEEAERLRRAGMDTAASHHPHGLEAARKIARELAKKSLKKECNADQVQHLLEMEGIALGNSAGALFKSSEWEWTGEYVKSVRVRNHARLLRVWRLVA